jgi:putative SOS response-associated peptidase YedK
MTVDAGALAELFELAQVPAELPKSYNIAPTSPVAVVRVDRDGQRRLDQVRWGLVPHWTKGENMPAGSINARAETVATKPSFRGAWRRRRCLIATNGFYEWKRSGARKQPYLIRLPDGGPFAFAGLWERWQAPNGSVVDSCAIITTEANPLVQLIHPRMPAVIPPEAFDRWLDRDAPKLEALQALLEPPPSDQFTAYPVSLHVNRPGNDDPHCVQPQGSALTVAGDAPNIGQDSS